MPSVVAEELDQQFGVAAGGNGVVFQGKRFAEEGDRLRVPVDGKLPVVGFLLGLDDADAAELLGNLPS